MKSVEEVQRDNGAVIIRDRRDRTLIPCALQPRDVAIVNDVRRYQFLTADQLRELWWPENGPRAANRRLRKLFDAGYLDRFRPLPRRGSRPWTYQLAAGGHRLLQHAGHVDPRQRFRARTVYDYSYVAPDIQLNAWVLAYRRAVGGQLMSWEGETEIAPPDHLRKAEPRLEGNWSADGLRDPNPQPVCPNAALTVEDDRREQHQRTILIEYDRTQRLGTKYEKSRRYDSFLTWWWNDSVYGDHSEPPFVLFVCEDCDQRDRFLRIADRELTGHRWHPYVSLSEHEYTSRHHILFANGADAHHGDHEAIRVPSHPAGHPLREDAFRRVGLPGAERAQNADRASASRGLERRLQPTPVDLRA